MSPEFFFAFLNSNFRQICLKVNILPHSVFEVGNESLGFVTLDLPMLDGTSSQVVVQLDGLVGGHRGLVVAGLKTQPDVSMRVIWFIIQ